MAVLRAIVPVDEIPGERAVTGHHASDLTGPAVAVLDALADAISVGHHVSVPSSNERVVGRCVHAVGVEQVLPAFTSVLVAITGQNRDGPGPIHELISVGVISRFLPASLVTIPAQAEDIVMFG